MSATPEVIDQPLTYEALGTMYRRLCDDPMFANIPGKVEIDAWGRMVLRSPASNYHGNLQARLVERLMRLGGDRIVEASVLTPVGVLVPDVVWASDEFITRHGKSTPFEQAPELCIEVASPSNSRKELNEKVAGLLAAGAVEAWIVYSQSKRIEYHGDTGILVNSSFDVDLHGLFDQCPESEIR